jgi:transketolase
VSIGHYHISTLKPFDQPQIIEAIASSRFGAITMENHSIIGGLGSILAEQLAEAGVGRPLRRLGLQDTFAHGASKPYLMREYGIDARALLQASERAIGESLGLEDREIKVGFAPAGHSRDKIEAL